jgi:hypothetical protein
VLFCDALVFPLTGRFAVFFMHGVGLHMHLHLKDLMMHSGLAYTLGFWILYT